VPLSSTAHSASPNFTHVNIATLLTPHPKHSKTRYMKPKSKRKQPAPQPNWLSRSLFLSPAYFTLCTKPSLFWAALEHLKIKPQEWPAFTSHPHGATMHTFDRPDGMMTCIICINAKTVTKHYEPEQIVALLVHECVHIWQKIREFVGERNPSWEFEAYAIQNLVQAVLEEYACQQKKPRS
jgi:hypothetical protein